MSSVTYSMAAPRAQPEIIDLTDEVRSGGNVIVLSSDDETALPQATVRLSQANGGNKSHRRSKRKRNRGAKETEENALLGSAGLKRYALDAIPDAYMSMEDEDAMEVDGLLAAASTSDLWNGDGKKGSSRETSGLNIDRSLGKEKAKEKEKEKEGKERMRKRGRRARRSRSRSRSRSPTRLKRDDWDHDRDPTDDRGWKRDRHGHENGSRRGRQRSRSPTRSLSPPMFEIDLNPATVSGITLPVPLLQSLWTAANTTSAETASLVTVDGIILPPHVTLANAITNERALILAPPPNSDEEDFIEYLDYEGRKAPGMQRYFQDEAEGRGRKIVCMRCGEEGHIQRECDALICMTCGARGEHSTISCPVSKTCFRCGMKGHISSTCTTSFQDRLSNMSCCARCGATYHSTHECPTLWRLYMYLDAEERVDLMAKKREEAGDDGEEDAASVAWCYNCSDSGHWGDDCPEQPGRTARFAEPSAFGSYNMSSGPYFDPDAPAPSRSKRRRDDAGVWGSMPLHVGKLGKQARQQAASRAWEQARRPEEDEGQFDWFGSRQSSGKRSRQGDVSRSDRNGDRNAAGRRLETRLSGITHGPRPNSSRSSGGGENRRADSRRDWEPERFEDRDRRTTSRSQGPRYRGGYSR